MLFAAHDEDGRIYMANKVYDPEGYENKLRDHGHDRFVAHESPGLRSPDMFFANGGALARRPFMPIAVDKTTIKAGDSDAAIFRGIEKGTRVRIVAAGAVLHDLVLQDAELELHIPVPCTYRVIFERWPCRDRAFEIEAVA